MVTLDCLEIRVVNVLIMQFSKPIVFLHFICRYSLEYPVVLYLQYLLTNVANEPTFHTHTRQIDALQFCAFQSLSF